MNKKEVTFNVKYEIVLYTPVFNARWGGGAPFSANFFPFSFQEKSVCTVKHRMLVNCLR